MFFFKIITVICRYVSGLTSDELEPQEEEEQLPRWKTNIHKYVYTYTYTYFGQNFTQDYRFFYTDISAISVTLRNSVRPGPNYLIV